MKLMIITRLFFFTDISLPDYILRTFISYILSLPLQVGVWWFHDLSAWHVSTDWPFKLYPVSQTIVSVSWYLYVDLTLLVVLLGFSKGAWHSLTTIKKKHKKQTQIVFI